MFCHRQNRHSGCSQQKRQGQHRDAQHQTQGDIENPTQPREYLPPRIGNRWPETGNGTAQRRRHQRNVQDGSDDQHHRHRQGAERAGGTEQKPGNFLIGERHITRPAQRKTDEQPRQGKNQNRNRQSHAQMKRREGKGPFRSAAVGKERRAQAHRVDPR